jgi:hypothetical protein
MNKRIEIHLGCLSPKISTQLRRQKLKFDKEKIKDFEILRESIMHLDFGRLISDKLALKTNLKLFKQIQSHVLKANKLKLVKPK